MTHLGSLTDEELISRVRVSQVATPLEKELARRLADARDQIVEHPKEIEALKDQIDELNDEIRNLENAA